MLRRKWKITAGIVGVTCAWAIGFWSLRPRPSEPAVGPLVQEIQRLGQLHTVRYNLRDVVEHERALEPSGLLASVPGAAALYRAGTKNTVVVIAEGGVEAGVDLSQVTEASVTKVPSSEGARLRIRLPRATLFPPQVNVRVVQRQSGLFWKNENIVPEVTAAAQQRFQEAAYRSDILATAETNAVETLSKLQRVSGNEKVEFYF